MKQDTRARLRAMKTVAMADGEFHDLERRLIETVQELVLKSSHDLDELDPIDGEELREQIAPEHRRQLLDQCIVVALIDGDASSAELNAISGFAKAFNVAPSSLTELRRLVNGQYLLFRIDVLRRSFIGQRIQDFVDKRGFQGVRAVLRGMRGKAHEETAARYLALADYPQETLGRRFYDFTRANDFSFPGEAGGPPEPIVFHDCLHVLGEYGTDPAEETQIAAFQAGILKQDPMFGLLFVLGQFQLGVQVTPVAEARRLMVEPELLLKNFLRGTRVNRDLCTDWEPWEDFDRKVAELRLGYGIEPRAN